MLYTILIGFVIGFLAKWILPGKDPGDGKGFVPILITILIGVAGSFLGGQILVCSESEETVGLCRSP
ncbi:hypothetical protein N9B21_00015 [Verrucomicrobiales bacterium]|nr:hypothetical protein [Verrucomicrobiales bacterium]